MVCVERTHLQAGIVQLLLKARANVHGNALRAGLDTPLLMALGAGHARAVNKQIRQLGAMDEVELFAFAKEHQCPLELVREVKALGRLPVVNFAAGGVATPADAAMMMQLGADGVFVGSGIFKSGEPVKRAEAIVQATRHFDNPDVVAKVSRGLGEAMVGINVADIPVHHRLEDRGW